MDKALKALQGQNEQRRLSKEDLLSPKIQEVDEYIESLGGTVRLKSLSYAERQEIRQKSGFGTEQYDEDRFTMLGIIFSVVEPKLTEEDYDALLKQDQRIIEDLIFKITMLNMLGRADEVKKESSETPSSESPSK